MNKRKYFLGGLAAAGVLAAGGIAAARLLRDAPDPRNPQDSAPYAEALIEEARKQGIRLQAPGPQNQSIKAQVPRRFAPLYDHPERHDVSVMTGVDRPRPGQANPWRKAEELAARLFGASACAFNPHGASFANHSAVKALVLTAGRGKTFLCADSVHISVIHALSNLEVNVRFLPVEHHPLGFTTALDPEVLRHAADTTPNLGGIIVTSPEYQGTVGNLRAYKAIAEEHNVAILGDQSWEIGLGFSDLLSESMIRLGYSIVTTSPHKMVPVVRGGNAMSLLGTDGRIPLDLFQACVTEDISTSKPSAGLADLDIGRRYLALHAADDIARLVETFETEMARFNSLDLGARVIDFRDEIANGRTVATGCVPYRVVVDTHLTGWRGTYLGALMLEKGVQIAQPSVFYLNFGAGLRGGPNLVAGFRALEQVLRELRAIHRPDPLDLTDLPTLPAEIEEINFRGLLDAPTENVPLEKSLERLSRYTVGTYPPGHGIWKPKGMITARRLDFVVKSKRFGASLYGQPDAVPTGYVKVLRES
jgi:arginine/lysine/ornithine decarboxylase